MRDPFARPLPANDSNDREDPEPQASRVAVPQYRGGTKNEATKRELFARQVHALLDQKVIEVSLQEVSSVLESLSSIQVPLNRQSSNTLVPAIDFTANPNAVTFAATFIDQINATDGRGLYKAICSVFDDCQVDCKHPITANSGQLPNIVQQLDYELQDRQRAPFEVKMSNYYPKKTLRAALERIRAEGREITDVDFFACFDKHPVTVVDCDPFKVTAYSVYKNNKDLFQRDDEGYLIDRRNPDIRLPSNDMKVYLEQQRRALFRDTDRLYPRSEHEYTTPDEYRAHVERIGKKNKKRMLWSRMVLGAHYAMNGCSDDELSSESDEEDDEEDDDSEEKTRESVAAVVAATRRPPPMRKPTLSFGFTPAPEKEREFKDLMSDTDPDEDEDIKARARKKRQRTEDIEREKQQEEMKKEVQVRPRRKRRYQFLLFTDDENEYTDCSDSGDEEPPTPKRRALAVVQNLYNPHSKGLLPFEAIVTEDARHGLRVSDNDENSRGPSSPKRARHLITRDSSAVTMEYEAEQKDPYAEDREAQRELDALT